MSLTSQLYRRLTDRLGLLLDQRDPLMPPSWMFADPDRLDGSRNAREFIAIGESTVDWLIGLGLAPHHRVLDVGSGIGRMALPLTRHLRDGGSYDGLEVAPYKVAYARKTISNRFHHFRFHHADVFNHYYNPTGRQRAAAYAFPFESEAFDFVFLISVFTHMLPGDVERYVSEIGRVLKPGGTCVVSMCLSDATIGEPYHRYSDVCELYRLDEPEHGVIYVERHVCELFEQHRLHVDTISYGYWRQRPGSCHKRPQDILIAIKSALVVPEEPANADPSTEG
jgi:SAM-dependent methyltransferase